MKTMKLFPMFAMVAVLLTAYTINSHADDGVYVGAGMATFADIKATSPVADPGAAAKLTIGARRGNLALEANWLQSRTADGSPNAGPYSVNTSALTANQMTTRQSWSVGGYGLSLLGFKQVGQGAEVFGRVGAYHLSGDASVDTTSTDYTVVLASQSYFVKDGVTTRSSTSASYQRTVPVIGFGLDLQLAGATWLRLEYESIGLAGMKVNDYGLDRMQSVTAGVTYRF